MAVETYKIGKKAVKEEQLDDDSVGRAKVKCLKFGTVSITPPVVDAQNVATGTVAVSGLKTTDKILVMMQEDAQKEAIPVAAYCAEDGVLTIQFANITTGTATTSAKEILWIRCIP
ncbi:hypothetical protein J7J74_01590 [bacterium]|nr:hypothetical protein [bacterium]